MLGLILSIIVVGLIAGALARLLVPGRQGLSIPMTILLGIVGSFVGGLLFGLLSGRGFVLDATGLIGSVIGALIALFIWRRMGGRRGATV